VGLLTFVTFARCLSAGFLLYDDPDYVSKNPYVLSGLTGEGLVWSWTTFEAANWHPLVWMSLMLDRTLFGPAPWGFHLTNVVLHSANAMILSLAVRELTGEMWRPALVALLFSLHPQRVESVAWIAERKDVLSGLFWVLAVWAYAVWGRRGRNEAWWLCLAALAVGLTAKQMLVTLPCALVLLDIWPLGRWSGRVWGADAESGTKAVGDDRASLPNHKTRSLAALIGEKWPMFLVVAGACVVVLFAQASAGAVVVVGGAGGVPLPERLRTALTAYGLYVMLMAWPVPLTVFYPYDYARFGWGGALLSAGAWTGLLVAALWRWRQRQGRRNLSSAIGLLWFLGTFVPVIGLVQVGQQALADRYTYIPSIGIALALAWCLPVSPSSCGAPGRAGWMAAGLAVLLLAGVTVWQTGFWQNTERLFARSLEVTSRNHLAHFLLGEQLKRQGKLSEAAAHFMEATRIDTVSVNGAKSWCQLGWIHSRRDELEPAEQCFARALAQVPDLTAGLEGMGSLWVNQVEAGQAPPAKLVGAAKLFQQAIRQDPRSFAAHYGLGVIHLLRGDAVNGEREIAIAAAIDTESEQARMLLAELRARRERAGRSGPR
jgi:tetratricopeptide (TPR) repeat protein